MERRKGGVNEMQQPEHEMHCFDEEPPGLLRGEWTLRVLFWQRDGWVKNERESG